MAKPVPLDMKEEQEERTKYAGLTKAECDDIQNAITRQKTKSSELSGDLSGKFDIFEKRGGNKSVAKLINSLSKKDPQEQADWERQFKGQAAAAGLFTQTDMVDQMAENEKNASVSNTVREPSNVKKMPTQQEVLAGAH